jgi:hypothetical protein
MTNYGVGEVTQNRLNCPKTIDFALFLEGNLAIDCGAEIGAKGRYRLEIKIGFLWDQETTSGWTTYGNAE